MKYLMLVLAAFLCGCVGNSPFRMDESSGCEHSSGCGKPYEINDGYDIAFFEFSERGHDFNPTQTSALLKRIKAASDKEDIALVVFVHGWRHNASSEDENVKSFNKALARIVKSDAAKGKKLIGVYVGWRGMSFHGLELEGLTFWDRKATAEQVGRGGVNELFLNLEHIAAAKPKNFMLTIGHSFGAAITLTALHDTLLSKMMAIERGEQTKSFGDGVVLLNPAIEANQALLLKEHSMKIGAMGKTVPSVMYVVSSRADWPTNFAFPIGQKMGIDVRTSQVDIHRRYQGRDYVISEKDLDSQTVGNYGMFTTSVMSDADLEKVELKSLQAVEVIRPHTVMAAMAAMAVEPANNSAMIANEVNKFSNSYYTLKKGSLADWKLEDRCSSDNDKFGVDSFPCSLTDPIDFISVPESFISGHNDIFGDSVVSLLSTIVMKSLVEKNQDAQVVEYCAKNGIFSFEQCFSYYYDVNRVLTVAEEYAAAN
ncbi:hypothetical protein M2401_001114 [Pseudomonas sp. JUb42]|uniref:hypothetical protein n=1 Tax=Pseudomonas sp. JUb42 TaxID=2940611 RepID=UPI00216A15AD|nr:hypothetical protein [Pseudomonas sp. JUb42]MCS3467393.1 hypothetical protein [Pseudomonas sp. JUb42]